MKILIIGSGGREHALAYVYAKSKKVAKVFVAPGNDFMIVSSKKIHLVPQLLASDLTGLLKFAKKEKIDLVDVAADDQLALGYVDAFTDEGIRAFGPRQKAAEIEWNKAWARDFMQKYNLPIPHYKRFTSQQDAITYVQKLPEQVLYIKASGLAAGKGAIRAESKEKAEEAIRSMSQFGPAGEKFLIEECLLGDEFSFFALCDGKDYLMLDAVQDHKTVYEHHQGPNTGGMGCVTPATIITPTIKKHIERTILRPFLDAMHKEGRPFAGILYLGGMLINSQQVKIIEFNARWGDPEGEVILPGLRTDYLDIVNAIMDKQLMNKKILFDQKVRISIAGCARGYPEDYSKIKGKEIFGLADAMKLPGITIFGAGIKKTQKKWVVTGGRVFHLVAEGATIAQARERAYAAMSNLSIEGNNLHYRTDIGWREMMQYNR